MNNNNENTSGCSSCESVHGCQNSDTKFNNSKRFNTTDILTAVVVVLVVMSGIQVYQTQKLMGAVSGAGIRANGGQAQGGTLGLPSQVGGCG